MKSPGERLRESIQILLSMAGRVDEISQAELEAINVLRRYTSGVTPTDRQDDAESR